MFLSLSNAALASTLVAAVATPVPAESPSQVTWTAPPTCPAAATVQSRIEELLGGPLALRERVAVDGKVRAEDRGYTLSLRIETEAGVEQRSLRDRDCALLARSAALVVAVALDAAVDPAVVPPPQADPAREPTASTAAGPTSRSRAPEPPPQPTRTRAGAGGRNGAHAAVAGGLGLGMAPGATGGLDARVSWRHGPWRLQALGFHWFGRSRLVRTNAGVRSGLSGGGLRACLAPSTGPLSLPVCIGADAAALHSRGLGSAVDARTVRDLWIALVAGVGFETAVARRIALVTRLELTLAVRRPAVHLDGPAGPARTFAAPLAGFRLLLGPAFRLR